MLILVVQSEHGRQVQFFSWCEGRTFTFDVVRTWYLCFIWIGMPDDRLWGSIRFSFARTTTVRKLEQAVDALVEVFATIEQVSKTPSSV